MLQAAQIAKMQRYWDDVNEGDELPRLTMEVTFKKVILNAASTWDYFPGHHDPEYAKDQNQKTIYISTLFFQGFIDRVVTDWTGPETFIVKRRMSMQRSIYAGDTMYGEGKVTKRYVDDAGRHLIDIEIGISNQDGLCCPASVTAWLPSRAD